MKLKDKILLILGLVIIIPVTIILYFALFWTWGGGSSVNLLLVPIVFFLLQGFHVFMLIKFKSKRKIKLLVILSMLIIVPLLTMFLLFGIAGIFNLDVNVA